jgi:hypothetical protein
MAAGSSFMPRARTLGWTPKGGVVHFWGQEGLILLFSLDTGNVAFKRNRLGVGLVYGYLGLADGG